MALTDQQIWAWLEDVPDPEIPVISVVDLGVIRAVSVNDDAVHVTITATYSGCPAMAVIALDIETGLAKHGVTNLTLDTKIAPAWTTDWLSAKGKARLEDYGIAPPRAAGGPEHCPRCKSQDVDRVSQFGSTPCKAQWRCLSCLEPFDYFKCI
jgi:ring-1,2-phenylacetyl-CoA epoxidase subunit PaaD